jgi:FkbM family methyltransferase
MNPMNWMRRLIPARLRKSVKRRFGGPLTRLHPDWAMLAPIGPKFEPHVLFDVGAHHGWFFHCWKDWCPAAQIHAFEPTQESFEEARRLYGADPSIALNPVAVGETESSLQLSIMQDSLVSNSLLPHNSEAWQAIQYGTGTITHRTVAVTTIDAYCRAASVASIYLLKIDVQGFELNVLKGAAAMLPHIDHVFVESAIQPLYQGAPRFTAVADYLLDRGFHLMGLRAWHRGNHALVETDMLFRRAALTPPIDPAVDRIMTHAG